MKSLREEAARNPVFQEQWTDCIQDPMTLLTTVFSRLSWKDNDLKVLKSTNVILIELNIHRS